MSTTPAPEKAPDRTGADLDHVICCDDNTALCGIDVTAHTVIPIGRVYLSPDACVVCVELDTADVPCRPGCPT